MSLHEATAKAIEAAATATSILLVVMFRLINIITLILDYLKRASR